jgi:hypothetical protein
MPCENYTNLSEHAFVKAVFGDGISITKMLAKPNGFKVVDIYIREPTEQEFYCLRLSFCLSHLLTVIQQMEHTVLYMSNFSPSQKMTAGGINRATHLLWSVENYLIRTQTVYDRLLIMIDRLFNIQNATNKISHESIVTNSHIERTEIPKALKPVKKSIAKYYFDRNTIIHESSYMDDDLRKIEGYTILASDPAYGVDKLPHWKDEIRFEVKSYVQKKTREFIRINQNICSSMHDLFGVMLPIYLKHRDELNEKC